MKSFAPKIVLDGHSVEVTSLLNKIGPTLKMYELIIGSKLVQNKGKRTKVSQLYSCVVDGWSVTVAHIMTKALLNCHLVVLHIITVEQKPCISIFQCFISLKARFHTAIYGIVQK